MATEIERKFLVTGTSWQQNSRAYSIKQGYILAAEHKSVRVRTKGNHGYLTIKAAQSGFSAFEFEYQIPLADAEELLVTVCQPPIIEKTRYVYNYQGSVWEIDVFGGANTGLILAEIELTAEDQAFHKPDWVGQEVTGDPRYYNSRLTRHPFTSWEQPADQNPSKT